MPIEDTRLPKLVAQLVEDTSRIETVAQGDAVDLLRRLRSADRNFERADDRDEKVSKYLDTYDRLTGAWRPIVVEALEKLVNSSVESINAAGTSAALESEEIASAANATLSAEEQAMQDELGSMFGDVENADQSLANRTSAVRSNRAARCPFISTGPDAVYAFCAGVKTVSD